MAKTAEEHKARSNRDEPRDEPQDQQDKPRDEPTEEEAFLKAMKAFGKMRVNVFDTKGRRRSLLHTEGETESTEMTIEGLIKQRPREAPEMIQEFAKKFTQLYTEMREARDRDQSLGIAEEDMNRAIEEAARAEAEVQALTTQIQEVIAERNAQRANIELLTTMVTARGGANNRDDNQRVNLKAFGSIEKLDDGKKGPEFDSWISKIERRIQLDTQNFGNETAKLALIQFNLTGRADQLTAHRFKEGFPEAYVAAKDALDHLKQLFEDRNKQAEARKKYKKLIQLDKTFNDFYTEFLHLAYTGGIPEVMWKADLIDKITYDLQGATLEAQEDETIGYSRFATLCSKRDFHLKNLKAKKDQSRARQNQSQNQNKPQTTSSTTSITTGTTSPTTKSSKPDPKNVYSYEERKAFYQKKMEDLSKIKCYNCQEMGHYSKDCSKPKAPRVGQVQLQTRQAKD